MGLVVFKGGVGLLKMFHHWTEVTRLCGFRLFKILLVVLAITAFLHLVLLPAASGGYNDECFLPVEKRRILRNMVQNISRAFDKFGVNYWLDYGEF